MLKSLKITTSINVQLVLLAALFLLSSAVNAGQELRSERVVVVQPGETLSEIVQREMRSAVHWPAVAKHNNIQDAGSITVGQAIRIPQTYTRSNEYAVVLFVKGGAERRAKDRKRDVRLQRGDKIRVGDEIRTGSNGFVSVEFSSGSVVNVQPDSHISIVDLACEEVDSNCVIELYAGKGGVQSRVKQRPDQPVKFNIEIPSGSAAVRGTVFDLETTSTKVTTEVTDGKVDMSAQGVTAGVDAGFGVITKPGLTPGVPRMLLEPPTIKEVPLRLAKGDMIFWWDNLQAVSYNVAISQDEETSAIESFDMTSDPSFAVPVNLQGQYYINIRSVDTQGLKGMPTTLPVELVSTLSSVKAPSLVGQLIGEEAVFTLQEGVGSGVITYEIQIADNPTFKHAESYDMELGQMTALVLSDGGELWSRARAVFADFNVSKYSKSVRVSQ